MLTTIIDPEYSSSFLQKLDDFMSKIDGYPDLLPKEIRLGLDREFKYQLDELERSLKFNLSERTLKRLKNFEKEINELSQATSDRIIHLLSNCLAPQKGSGFDINDFFQVFDKIRLKSGKVLDYVLFDMGIGGAPLIYSRDAGDIRLSANQYLEKYGDDREPYLKDVTFDITDPIAHFQFSVFARVIDQFFLSWHSNYNDTRAVAGVSHAKKIIDEIPEDADDMKSERSQPCILSKSLLVVRLLTELRHAVEYPLKVDLAQNQAVEDTIESLEMILSSAQNHLENSEKLSFAQVKDLEICIQHLESELHEIQSLKEEIASLKTETDLMNFEAKLGELDIGIPTIDRIPNLDRQRLAWIDFSPHVVIDGNKSTVRLVTFSNWQGFAYEYSEITFPKLNIQRREKVLIPYDCGICF